MHTISLPITMNQEDANKLTKDELVEKITELEIAHAQLEEKLKEWTISYWKVRNELYLLTAEAKKLISSEP